MNRFSTTALILGSGLSIVVAPALSADSLPDGALSNTFIEALRDGYDMDTGDRARYNAITNTAINTLALNREVVRGEDGYFSHRIKSRGITDQQSSGRCWMFAGFNVIRPQVIHGFNLDGFEFSAAYLLFWDKMEKSNLYLEEVIELRDRDRLDREWQIVNEWMVGDGGWWNYVTALVGKYGVVPSSVMPETHSSTNTRTMNRVLTRLLRSRAVGLLEASEAGADVKELRELKREAMADVYRLLVLNLGEPPHEFEWRYEQKEEREDEGKGGKGLPAVAEERLSELKKYTPRTFYETFVGVDLSDYVALYHDPSQETGKHYRFERARNMVGEPEMNFVNVEIDVLKEVAMSSVLANQPLWFAVNMGIDQSRDHGLMASDLFDYEALFDLEMPFTKADRARFNAGASNHAMVLMGVDIVDGKPRKWLVENSWGADEGNKGMWTLHDDWFDEHVYTVITHKDRVPGATLAVFEEEAKTLPAWYPGARGMEFEAAEQR